MTLRLVTSETEWPAAVSFIEAACRRGPGDFRIEPLRRLCESGEGQLWMHEEGGRVVGALITSILNRHDGTKTCELVAYGGKHWPSALRDIELWAAEMGCIRVRLSGRRGWKRAFPEPYRVTGYILERSI